MTKPGSEERYPLLLLYVEENGRKSEFPQRVVFADKGRGKEVSQGAAAIINQWPAQVTSCWLTSIALGTTFIFLSILLLLSSLTPLSVPIRPRCTRDAFDFPGNKTIYLVKHNNNWNHKQLDVLQFIAETYPEFEIRNMVLDTSMKNFIKTKKNPVEMFSTESHIPVASHFHFIHMPDFTNTLVKKLNEMLKKDQITSVLKEPVDMPKENINATSLPAKRTRRNIRFFKLQNSYEDILKTYPNIKEEQTTYKNYFSNTPLQYYWRDLKPDVIIFSIRVLELWQNGGLSFHLPHHHHEKNPDEVKNVLNSAANDSSVNKTTALQKIPSKIVEDNVNISRLKLLIASTKFRYEKLKDDLVSIDGQGLHMVAKIPCHAFFGEMIMKLQKNSENLTVDGIIQKILNTFCGRGAVDSDYCLKKK